MIPRTPQRKHPRLAPDGKIRLDSIDDAILEIMSEDSRTPILEISRRVYLSRGAVIRRVHQLIDAGVIKRFTIEIDREKLAN